MKKYQTIKQNSRRRVNFLQILNFGRPVQSATYNFKLGVKVLLIFLNSLSLILVVWKSDLNTNLFCSI